MKAQLDENAKQLNFDQLIILKPSILDGLRKEKRNGEKFSVLIGNLIGKSGCINNYKPVKAINVARCMLQSFIELSKGYHEIDSNEINSFTKR